MNLMITQCEWEPGLLSGMLSRYYLHPLNTHSTTGGVPFRGIPRIPLPDLMSPPTPPLPTIPLRSQSVWVKATFGEGYHIIRSGIQLLTHRPDLRFKCDIPQLEDMQPVL